ncbi:MAG: hypothetical protein ACKPJO_24565 [Dolichospermum sp.]
MNDLLSHFDISVVPIKPISEKEYPISFSPAMVQAIQENRKTQTRRKTKPPCKKGDLLWVQENYRLLKGDKCCDDNEYWCKYDDDTEKLVTLSTVELTKLKGRKTPHDKKQPGRFMYRSCSRILLEVTDIYNERLQDISDEDAIAEGIEKENENEYRNYVETTYPLVYPSASFHSLWESIYGAKSWLDNPYVWVIKFERLETKTMNDLLSHLDICVVSIKPSEYDCLSSHLDKLDSHKGWEIKYYAPNGGVLALDITDKQGNYLCVASDHIDPDSLHDHFAYAKEAIDQISSAIII